MAAIDYGYVYGERRIIRMLVKSGEAIQVNDLVDLDASGYLQAVDAGDIPFGVAVSTCAAPSSDGGAFVDVDTSTASVYRYPLSAGAVARSLIGKSCDIGGAQSIDATASTDDCVEILDVDTAASLVYVCLIRKPAGVV